MLAMTLFIVGSALIVIGALIMAGYITREVFAVFIMFL